MTVLLKRNMNKRTLFSALLLAGFLTAGAAGFTRQQRFVTIPLTRPYANGPRLVRLEVMGPKIIRVEATAESAFPQKQSLIIVPQTLTTPYKVTEDGDNVYVSTNEVRARVSKSTGRVVFFDAAGREIAAENATAGKTLRPFTVPAREIGVDSVKVPAEQRRGWTWTLQFDNDGTQGYYGLGQHQANELNMKGRNEDLYQYNTKVSVPFVVSNRNYGILWDAYSYGRFGNPADYLQLNRAFTLYDANGVKGYLTGTYTQADGKTIQRDEDSIYYEYLLPDIPRRGDG